ncbi:DUF2796 domain-containing protein [Marinobacter sp. CHS3-4]|uniref:ZrgA family zinc uptake protein n=1 Tax=Marinobacter sp. CHS3-4 TaxID=3045174 RepID=UPI0024B610C6|nr:DUF2796 domain-containing protein [Marinobacter sp. CHS3-4]MDI9244316.1 DUF2796 domain-containing protein [Marinobacter sp. CHS3-4]
MPDFPKTHPVFVAHRSKRAGIAICAMAACAVHTGAFAADNLGAHEHGHARLQMALEDDRIDLMFTSPAYNLAGFEHKARTAEEKARQADIRRWLETHPLVNTSGDDCSLSDSIVRLGGSTDAHDDHDHHGEHSHADEITHRDYEVTQQLTCNGNPIGQSFVSAVMTRFPEVRALDIEWVSATGQGSLEMTSPESTFTLSQ